MEAEEIYMAGRFVIHFSLNIIFVIKLSKIT